MRRAAAAELPPAFVLNLSIPSQALCVHTGQGVQHFQHKILVFSVENQAVPNAAACSARPYVVMLCYAALTGVATPSSPASHSSSDMGLKFCKHSTS